MHKTKAITLEMSLKPFKENTEAAITSVCHTLFVQWQPLLKDIEEIFVLLWIGDGSEILEYSGDLDAAIEWGKYIGRANESDSDWDKPGDPEKIGPHARKYLYIDNPPSFTYSDIGQIVGIIKASGKLLFNKDISVGATFDPGPEFAVSEFKYSRHPEICTSGSMGDKSFLVGYETLKGDDFVYKAYPEGIPDQTEFATFFGKQCHEFLTDFDFDYIWFSNGFGFGAENWSTVGPLFDGQDFKEDLASVEAIRNKIIKFWDLFRQECPHYPVHTRGTNLSVGIDFATDGVALKEIYDGNYDILPPPNSPWAALDKNFGLELSGYMSRIAEIPHDKNYMYRFYLHDPWWINSPWFDRYEGEAHDIYLPLGIGRLNQDLQLENPSYINFLTVDTSLGDLPDDGARSVIYHLGKALGTLPDKVSPFVWVYPFAQYQHVNENHHTYRLKKPFFEDWYITSAINYGIPLNTVVSSDHFILHSHENHRIFKGSILVVSTPEYHPEMDEALLCFIEKGGQVLLYGSLSHASRRLLEALNLQITDSIDGLLVHQQPGLSGFETESDGNAIFHDPLLSDDGIDTIVLDKDADFKIISKATRADKSWVTGISRPLGSGTIAWLRGTNSSELKPDSNLLIPHDESLYFRSELQLRQALQLFDYHIEFIRKTKTSKLPVLGIHRHQNAFMISGYLQDTTVAVKLRFPLGIPVLIGHEVLVEDHYGYYHFPRSFSRECRVFVQQKAGKLSMTEYGPVSMTMKRRVLIEGLEEATVYVFPEENKEAKCELLLNSKKPNIVGEPFEYTLVETDWGKAYEVKNITGHIMYSMEFDDVNYLERKKKQ